MENSPETQSNKWLIIFLIYADFTTKKDADDIQKLVVTVNNMLSDIITTPIDPEKSRMFVVMNSIRFVFNDPKNGIDDKCAFYTIERTLDRTQNYIADCELIDNSIFYNPVTDGGQVLQKPLQLKAVLKKTCIKADEEVFLITWDHGSAFGMFRVEPPAINVVSVRNEVEKDLQLYPYLKMFWDKAKKSHRKNRRGEIIDIRNFRCPEWEEPKSAIKESLLNQPPISNQSNPTVTEILKNCELNTALQAWLGDDRKIGVLLMTNCWMMNMHTMYALKNSVKCLVAPQGDIDCPGYNIKDILIKINKHNKTIIPIELAKTCVETIDNDYSKAKARLLSPNEPDVIECFKIFAVDLSKTINNISAFEIQLELLKKIVDLLISGFTSQNSTDWNLKFFLQYTRSVCFDFADFQVRMIDVVNWMQTIEFASDQFTRAVEGLSGELYNPISSFIDFITSKKTTIVLKSSSGKKIYAPKSLNSPPFAVIGLPPTGHSIFFPLENIDDPNIKDNILSDQLLEEFGNWTMLLSLMNPEVAEIFTPTSCSSSENG